MKIAICDDDSFYNTQILEYANIYSTQNLDIPLVFSVFKQAEDLIEATQKIGGFDIYILDIVMPDINGIELGLNLRKLGYNGRIIYLTSSKEFAVDSYKVKAFNYILKPVLYTDFASALDEAVKSLLIKKEKSILVKSKENTIRIGIDSIMYAQLLRRRIFYYISNGEIIESTHLRTTFSEAIQELLHDSRFFLCGKSMAVNLQHISKISTDEIVFKNNNKVFLNSKMCRELRSVWSDYWFNRGGLEWRYLEIFL